MSEPQHPHRKVNLGCSVMALEGFCNVDIVRPAWADAPGAPEFMIGDVEHPLPFEAASCSLILCHHLLEHLDYDAGLAFLKDCYRALEMGGILSLALPNFEWLIERFAAVGTRDPWQFARDVQLILYTCYPPRGSDGWRDNYFNVHKAAYYPALLQRMAADVGFTYQQIPQEQFKYLSGYGPFQLCAYLHKLAP